MVTVGKENQGYHFHRMRQNGGFHSLLTFLLSEKIHANRPYKIHRGINMGPLSARQKYYLIKYLYYNTI